jgi:glycosyltransferase involved in cell wall biosynthesis
MIVVPVYNHGATLADVVRAILLLHPHVLVVDDASTDLRYEKGETRPDGALVPAASHPLCGLAVPCLRHPRNLGKGAAILTGAAAAGKNGMTHIVTIDADDQHDPADLPRFLAAAGADPLAIYVGERDFNTPNVPFSSRFGRRFSNFWYAVQTGRRTKDAQSGFRLYPLAVLDKIRCLERRYGFETEVLVRAAWAGFAVKNLPIKVRYRPARERVSHFRPLADNLRLTLLNSWLTARSFMPWPQKKFLPDGSGGLSALHPLRSLRLVLADRTTPKNAALAAAIGMGVSALPIFGLHTMAILLLTGVFRVNRFVGLAAGQLGMPPLVPALCIEAGHYFRHGRWLTEISLQTLGYEALDRVWEWCLGSLALAPLLGIFCGALVYAAAWGLNRTMRKH